MAHLSAPWQSESKLTLKAKIAYTDKPPKYHSTISDELRDFMNSCFQIDPNMRANVYELTRHPFIQQMTLKEPLAYLVLRKYA